MSLASAIETGDVAALPSRRDEDWRWTDLRGLIRVLPPASPIRTFEGVGPFSHLTDDAVVVINGRGPGRIDIPAGAAQTIALRIIATADAGAHACHLRVEVGEGARLTLLETYEGHGADAVTEAALDIDLHPGARLERLVLADDDPGSVSVSTAMISLGARSNFAQTILTTGAKRQRIETHVNHPGGGASVRLDGVYRLSGARHADITTVVTHAGVDGATDQLTKGAVADQARGVFQGRIVVEPGADRTVAKMGHHALILSDRAEVDAKPELEINADDVACAHGNTIGALDEEALFYAEARGIPEAEARAMLAEAFLAEVVDRIEHGGARAVAHAWLSGAEVVTA